MREQGLSIIHVFDMIGSKDKGTRKHQFIADIDVKRTNQVTSCPVPTNTLWAVVREG
jgi:hypothetical protein